MKDQELVDAAIEAMKAKEEAASDLETYKAAIQERGLFVLGNRNNRYCRIYGNDGNLAAVSEAQEIDILNMERLKSAIGEGVAREKVVETAKTAYKLDKNLERAVKAIFTGDYTFEYTLEEFLDHMSIPVDTKKKNLLMKRLKGEYKADKKTFLSVFGYLTKENTEEEAEKAAPDFDVELYYISKIKNTELIRAFLPEEDIEWSIEEVRKSVLVESKLKIELSYRKDA